MAKFKTIAEILKAIEVGEIDGRIACTYDLSRGIPQIDQDIFLERFKEKPSKENIDKLLDERLHVMRCVM